MKSKKLNAKKKRKIAVFTGNRAEYGLQYPVLKAIAINKNLKYYLIVSGAHLKKDLGYTVQEITSDGFKIYTQVGIEMPGDDLFAVAQAIGSGIVGISRTLSDLKPDFLVVYGDRFESFSAMIAGTQMGIPTAHIEGGDYTEGGSLDDSVRHAMTKLAHLHFTTNDQAAERVLRMGEEPWRIHNVGLPVLDFVASGDFATPQEVSLRFNLDLKQPILIFTQHSVATQFSEALNQIRPSLAALGYAAKELGSQVIVTYPNDDAGGRRIIQEIKKFTKKRMPSLHVTQSLGRYYYHGVLNVAAACIGNSSSGIKETPIFHCPCIDIGDRQQGRLRSSNVIQVGYQKEEIKRAIWRCLHDKSFLKTVQNCVSPYGVGNAGQRIAEVLATTKITRDLIKKRMTY